jgi:hypothetical protein
MTKLRVVAGTDVMPPTTNRLPSHDAIYELLEPVYELFERHRQAKLEYDRAIAEVARRAGRDLRSVAGALKVLKRKRAARFEPEDWCNLM